MNYYHYNGLRIKSEITLHPLIAIPIGNIDVTIKLSKIPETLLKPVNQQATFMIEQNRVLIFIPKLARFLIENGSEITVETELGCPLQDLSPFVLGVAWAALCYQRNQNLLKGSLVEIKNQLWLLSGTSPIGSSTFGLGMQKFCGATVISDEFCSYTSTENGIIVQPGLKTLKLWRNTLDFFEIDTGALTKVRSELHKYWLPLDLVTHTKRTLNPKSLKLQGIIHLQQWRSDDLSPFGIQELKGFKALKKVYHHSFHRIYMSGQSLWEHKFKLDLKLVEQCQLLTFTFERDWDSLQDSCIYLQEHIINND